MICLPGKIVRQANQSAMVRRFRQGLQRLARLLEILMNDFQRFAQGILPAQQFDDGRKQTRFPVCNHLLHPRFFGRTAALLLSSAIYSITHLVRSPAKFYVTGVHPMAGFETLGLSLAHAANPALMLPTFIGLFLLGIVLAEAFLETGTVYFPIGLHAGFVMGAKLWPRMTSAGLALPGWLSGYGSQPLISGLAAWSVAIAILLLIRPLTRRRAA